MTRVTYKENNGMLVSQEMVAGHLLVKVSIDPSNKRYTITAASEPDPIAVSKMYDSLSQVKTAAKHALKLLGVVFDDEVRKRVKKDEQETQEDNGQSSM